MAFQVLLSPFVITALLTLPFTAYGDENDEGSLEGLNRSIAKFNDKADAWVLKPLAQGYKKITPDPVEKGFSNFFDNLKELINIPNDLLQGKLKQAANDTGRLLINSTFGLAGFLDAASTLDLQKNAGEDLGQTLAVWGVPSGPYIVVPFLGPSTLRDLPSQYADTVLFSAINYVDDVALRNTLWVMDIIDTRAGLLESEKLISGDRYTFIKDAYLQRREFLVKDGEVEDDFGGYGDEDFSGYGDEDF